MNEERMPLMPLRDMIIYPGNVQALFVGRQASKEAVRKAFASQSRQIFLVAQKSASAEAPELRDLYKIGVVCRILQILPMPDDNLKVLCEGLYRAECGDPVRDGDFLETVPVRLPEVDPESEERDVLVAAAHSALEEDDEHFGLSQESLYSIISIKEPGPLADAILQHLKCDFKKKQSILEIPDSMQRLEQALSLLEAEKSLAAVEKRIQNRVKMQMEHNQREYYLTEQIKAINKEMGREDDPQAEIEELEQRIKAMDMPVEARDKALAEAKKMRGMTPMVAEYAVSRGYIEWILDLPWNNLKPIGIDIAKARAILDGDHYGLQKAKERILEYLAVQKLSANLKGQILCFAGPPGVGKTSLAASVARATGREFARLSLGGVRDEAEIRGHRRTYVGALPGKIIQTLKRVKSNNPLICLDEIDKISAECRGDPAAALLEVLDPAQNNTFMDHYLDLEYDLSNIFFITTANSLQNIPAPLLDRMEIIELPSYLETEKLHIARDYLLPRQMEQHGIREENLKISDNALREIIQNYTRESGVRSLERQVAALCRKTAIRLVEGGDLDQKISVSTQNLPAFLGIPKYRHEERENEPKVGVCAGLAYNQSGGDILFVETSIMSGNGQITATGQLGEVMTESARAALTYVRSRAPELGLNPAFYRKIDIHVHVPSGATPKDGPSAGITLATSITSALLGLPVRNDLAMTGEISLRGRVLPVGGLREKLLAAKRGGMKTVILPADNEKDLEEVPAEALKNLEIIFVDSMDKVLPVALGMPEAKIFPNRQKGSQLLESLR